MGGHFPGGNFPREPFSGGNFPGSNFAWGNFRGGGGERILLGIFFLEPRITILIFHILKLTGYLNIKIYILIIIFHNIKLAKLQL